MKKLFIIILLLKCCFSAQSQNISVSINASQKFSLKDDKSFIGLYKGNYIFFYIDKAGKYDKLLLEYYDAKLSLINSIQLDLFSKTNASGLSKFVFDKVYLYKGKIQFLVSEFNKSKDETYLHCFTVNPLDATLIDFKTLDTVSIKGLNIMLNRYSLHKICFAKDSSKIGLIRYKDYATNNFGNISTSGKKIQLDMKDSFHTKVYDADFNLIDKKSLLFPFKTDLYHGKSTMISTEGNIYIYSVLTGNIPNAVKKYFTYVGCKEPGYKTYEFDKKGEFSKILLKENNKKEVMAIALYGSKSIFKLEGFYVAVLDKDNINREQFIIFNADFYEKINKYSIKEMKNNIESVNLNDVFFSEKNDIVFCTEEEWTNLYKKAICFSYNEDLKLNWAAIINKKQFDIISPSSYGYGSFVSNYNENGLNIIFNDSPKNINKGIKYKADDIKSYDKTVVRFVNINNQGELTSTAVGYNNKLGSVLNTKNYTLVGKNNILFTAKFHKNSILKFYNIIF